MSSDYYSTLGVSKNASKQEINTAYKRLAKKHHPDINPGPESEKKIKEINEAYEVLKDDNKRAQYDQVGHQGFQSGYGSSGFSSSGWHQYSSSSSPFDSIFDFFNEEMGGGNKHSFRKKSQAKDGNTLRYNMEITLEEALVGVEKEVSFHADVQCEQCDSTGSRSKKVNTCSYCNGSGAVEQRSGFFSISTTCRQCQGEGYVVSDPCRFCNGKGLVNKSVKLKVKIPMGIQDKNVLNITEKGEGGIRGGKKGNLHIVISIKRHNQFKVQGVNLNTQIDINYAIAVLGGKVLFNSLGGEKIELNIQKSTKNNSSITVKGKGMPLGIQSTKRGNLVIQIGIDIPTKLSSEEKEVIEKLKSLNDNEDEEGFFSKVKNLW